MVTAVDSLRNQPTRRLPDIGGAFDYVKNNMFTSNNGDRPQARNFVVLLTGLSYAFFKFPIDTNI